MRLQNDNEIETSSDESDQSSSDGKKGHEEVTKLKKEV